MSDWIKYGKFVSNEKPRKFWGVVYQSGSKEANPHNVQLLYYHGDERFSRYQSKRVGYIDSLCDINPDDIQLFMELEAPELPSAHEIPYRWHIDQETYDILSAKHGEDYCSAEYYPVSNESWGSYWGEN